MTDKFKPGSNWASKDGQRNVVIHREVRTYHAYRGRAFAIRNLATGRVSNIEIHGLTRKFRFVGYDPAYTSDAGAG